MHTAASLILMRHGEGAPELLIVRRGGTLAFAAGAYAFPGGRVDAADRAAAAAFEGDPEDIAARIASLRELKEETGIVFGAAEPIAADLEKLVPFARWQPPETGQTRRFDTRFYLAAAAADMAVQADGGEIVEAFWSTARVVIERHQAGDGAMLFPTRCLLERLATFGSFDDARAHAAAMPSRLVQPTVAIDGDRRWLTIPDDAGYPYTRELIG